MNLPDTLLGTSIIATGLMSGLWYGWTVSVIPGTRRVADVNYVDTMQHINKAIINPAFIIPFMGIPFVLGVAAILQFRAGDSRRGWLLASANGTYVVGVLGVTIGGNVPLNDALDDIQSRGVRRTSHRHPSQNLRNAMEPLALPPHRSQHRRRSCWPHAAVVTAETD